MAIRRQILTGLVLLIISIGAFAQSETDPQPVETAEIPAESADINEFDNEGFLEEAEAEMEKSRAFQADRTQQ